MPVISQKRKTESNCKPCSIIFFSPFRVINAVTISDWDRIKSPNDRQVIPYGHLPQITGPEGLSKLAVLKVNGGLGTSMGMILEFPPHLCLRILKASVVRKVLSKSRTGWLSWTSSCNRSSTWIQHTRSTCRSSSWHPSIHMMIHYVSLKNTCPNASA